MEGCEGDERCICRAWKGAKDAAVPEWSFVGLTREQRGLNSVWIAEVESNVTSSRATVSVEADHPAKALRALTRRLGSAP